MLFCKKKIKFDATEAINSGMFADYHVNVQLLNCVGMSSRAMANKHPAQTASSQGIWVEKGADYFTIYISWTSADAAREHDEIPSGESATQNENIPSWEGNRNKGEKFAGFSVISQGIMDMFNDYAKNGGEISAGVAIYPSCSYQVIGIPPGYIHGGLGTNAIQIFNEDEPVIQLA